MLRFVLLVLVAPSVVLGQVVGSATGFAKGVTGGGSATPAVPADITELKEWLTDSTPRVIMLDKTYNFIGSEGTTTATGCRPASNTCGDSGQDAINGANWCDSAEGATSITVTYDTAGTGFIDVQSHKSIVGVGSKGVIQGKGLRIANGAQNVIIQNIKITDLNPEYIWGGDAITLAGSDLVWIDHCEFSLIGRQMIVTGYTQAGRVTISNNYFNGKTNWSASCNGDHYWTMLFLGANDQITLSNNLVEHCSGRAPKVGGSSETNVMLHAVNNVFYNIGGHDFDIQEGGQALIEGNIFQNVDTPMTSASSGNIFNAPSTSVLSKCQSYLGRSCVMNAFGSSGSWPSFAVTDFLSSFANAADIVKAVSTDGLYATVTANAGVGKIGN